MLSESIFYVGILICGIGARLTNRTAQLKHKKMEIKKSNFQLLIAISACDMRQNNGLHWIVKSHTKVIPLHLEYTANIHTRKRMPCMITSNLNNYVLARLTVISYKIHI